MYVSKQKPVRGFIALISVLILSFVLLVAVISLGKFGLSGRLLLLDIENKIRSEEFAEACVQSARILVASDPLSERSNIVIEPKDEGDISCTLVSLEYDADDAESTIKSRAVVEGATTNFVVVVDSATSDVLSWREYAQMP